MSRYLIYVDNPTEGWRLDRTDLLSRVTQDWPDANVINPDAAGNTKMRDLGWRIARGELTIECWSAKGGLGIEVDGDDELAPLVAAWYRKIVPESAAVSFSDDMYAAHVEIPPGASPADVQRLYDEA